MEGIETGRFLYEKAYCYYKLVKYEDGRPEFLDDGLKILRRLEADEEYVSKVHLKLNLERLVRHILVEKQILSGVA